MSILVYVPKHKFLIPFKITKKKLKQQQEQSPTYLLLQMKYLSAYIF